MRRLLVASVLIASFATTPVASQQSPPFRFGAHVAGNMMNGPFDMVRVGGQLVIPVGARLYAYPAVSRFMDGAEWEVTAALRYRPFGSPDGDSPFYVGVGWSGINWGARNPYTTSYDLWLTGVEVPLGKLRPYVEIQFLGPVHRLVNPQADWGVQAYSGITWAVR